MSFFSQKYFKDKEEEQDFFIALVVILFFGAGVYFFAFPAFAPQDNTVDVIAEKEPAVEKRKTNTSLDNEGAIDIEAYVAEMKRKKLESTEIKPPSVKPKNNPSTKSIAPVAVAVTAEKAQDVIDEFLEDTIEVVETEPAIEPEIAEETPTPTNEETAVIATEKASSFPADDLDCTIMIGAFKDALNAEVLKQRLTDESYEVYETRRGSFTLIGIKASCDPKALENALLVMRSNYSSDAFILAK